MKKIIIQGKAFISGTANGLALATNEPLSFWGGYDWKTGEIIDRRHPLSGMIAKDKILVIPFTRGSSTTTAVLLEAIHAKTAPKAIITTATDFFFALASVVADELYQMPIPLIAVSENDFSQIKTGDEIEFDKNGLIKVSKPSHSPQRNKMKLPAHLHLEKNNIPYEAKSFSPETEKGAANVAKVLNFSERQAVKTLIFQVVDSGECVLVMLGADQNAISGNLKKAIGSRNIQMTPPEKVKEITGYIIGSIPAFGWQPSGFRTFLEATLVNESILGTGAGVWGEEIMITPQNLIQASKAIVVNLTEREKPVFIEE